MRETLLTVNEVAEFVKVRPRTVRDWIDRGCIGIPVYRIHRQYRFKEEDVDDLLAKCVESGSPVHACRCDGRGQ
ncbi:MAG: helix-turn-helix domain-containing protein [Lentisphaerae bacterium]|jgi:excisionase family DNA binding protein|nr:helix-turn-helix domain-containing protein [Lentisphaerota bacterium]MBT5604634.1 helix-turn-helix domain-containing protein [Lentisphaerota bacterium]